MQKGKGRTVVVNNAIGIAGCGAQSLFGGNYSEASG